MVTPEQTERILKAYGRVARPIMRRFMTASSCIASARTTIEVMRLLGISSIEHPVSIVFQVAEKKYARVSGLSWKQKKEMRAKCANWRDDAPHDGGGWDGHLVVIVQGRWILDPSIDQCANEEFDVPVASEVLIVDSQQAKGCWTPRSNFHAKLGLLLDNGDRATLHYTSIRNRAYLDSEAWNDEGLQLLAHQIADLLMPIARTV